MNELYGVTTVMIIMSISLFLVGIFIKKTNAAELISGYEEKKDGHNKEFLAKLFGNGIILMGIISSITTIVYYFISKGTDADILKRNGIIAIGTVILSAILISVKLYYIMLQKRK